MSDTQRKPNMNDAKMIVDVSYILNKVLYRQAKENLLFKRNHYKRSITVVNKYKI